MRKSANYKLDLPERDIENGRNDPADIDVITGALEQLDSIVYEQEKADSELEKTADMHKKEIVLDHPDGSVTDAKIGNRKIGETGGGLQKLFDFIGEAFAGITGESKWNTAPATNLKYAAALEKNVIKKDNIEAYSPSEPYNPATKKYVDDRVYESGSGDMMRGEYATSGRHGIVDTAHKLAEKRLIALGGALAGSADFNGEEDTTICADVDGGTY